MMLLPNLGAVLTVVLGFLGLLFPKAVGRVLGDPTTVAVSSASAGTSPTGGLSNESSSLTTVGPNFISSRTGSLGSHRVE